MAIFQDTTYTVSFQITGGVPAVPVNITGWSLTAAFRQRVTDPDPPIFTLTLGDGFTITDAVNGKFTMVISTARTKLLPLGRIVFDIMRSDVVGAPVRLCGGSGKVKEAVTRLP